MKRILLHTTEILYYSTDAISKVWNNILFKSLNITQHNSIKCQVI